MRNYQHIGGWRAGFELAKAVYATTRRFPASERWHMTDQLRRAATSIPTNIAEGAGRPSNREFAYFRGFAAASASEVECLILLAQELGYLDQPAKARLLEMVQETRRLTTAYGNEVIKSA